MSAPITVNPLDWARNQWNWFSYDFPYEIRCEGGIGYLVDYGGHTLDGKLGGPHDTLDQAKVSANADHASRIMSCIEVDPNTRVVTVDQLDEWAVAIQAGMFWRYADKIRAIIGEVK